MALVASTASAGQIYFNGFETDIAGWNAFGGSFDASRVASGSGGITSASGGFHGLSSGGGLNASGSAGNWGGYNYGAGNAVPTVFQEYQTSVDVFLDVGAGFANDTRFDFTSAINGSGGTHRRDFAFNAGFYNAADVTGPGAGTDRFVLSASNNTGRGNAFPKNPGRTPISIGTTGWYTFTHEFFENGLGDLEATLSVFDSSNALVGSWSLSDTSDDIGLIGGNRYGWFARNEFSTLAIDNSSLTLTDMVIPLPTAGAMAMVGLIVVGARRRRV